MLKLKVEVCRRFSLIYFKRLMLRLDFLSYCVVLDLININFFKK